jgi:hypothetical protein
MIEVQKDNAPDQPADKPPLWKSWPNWYALVIANLLFWLFIFFLIRRIFE